MIGCAVCLKVPPRGIAEQKFGSENWPSGTGADVKSDVDTLLADAREADPENVLVSTFLSADVGKLYMTLASIVGWKK